MISNNLIRVLLIEDEEYDVRRVTNTLKLFSDRIWIGEVVWDGKSALDIISKSPDKYDVVIMDFQIAGGLMGEALIQKIKELDGAVQIIVITKMTINITDFNFASKLLKAGAYWYCTKYPGDIEEFIYQPTDFVISIFNAYEKGRLERERYKAKQKLLNNVEAILQRKTIVGSSLQVQRTREEIKKYSQSNVCLLIRGASGTGKELVAYNIHYTGLRKFENFVTINCGSLPNDLVESELFGYEKGAFTGADKRKLGLFEVAHNGTVFLDEITELPLSAQVKLLRVIQDGELEKIGRTEKVKVDVRVIAATNRNIEEEVKAKKFREDLYYRLNVISINVPDLRNRKEDIPELIEYFLEELCMEMGKAKPQIEPAAMEVFLNYQWPGNIRELKNIVQRLLFYDEEVITPVLAKHSLGYNLFDAKENFNGLEFSSSGEILPLKHMEKIFREKYFRFIRDNSESDTDAAKKLGLAPPNYYRMARELGLK